MLLETLRAEVQRRWAALIGLACLFVATPALYTVRLRHVRPAWFALAYFEAMILARVLIWLLVFSCAAWGYGSWAPERRGGWIYALALPVERLRLFAIRYAAGLLWLGVAMLALVAASFVAASVVNPPSGFYAYPGPYSATIALVALVAYTVGFVLGLRSSHSGFTLIMLLVAGVATIVVAGGRDDFEPVGIVQQLRQASPLSLLAEPPRLFDY